MLRLHTPSMVTEEFLARRSTPCYYVFAHCVH